MVCTETGAPGMRRWVTICRVEQLEGEVAGMRGQLAAARADLAGARADSVKLYEKIRYLQRFSAKQAASDGFQVVQVDSEGVSHPKVTTPSNPPCSLHAGGLLKYEPRL